MKAIRIRLAVVAASMVTATILLAAQRASPDTLGSSLADHPKLRARIEILDSWIAERVANHDQPGLSIGIVYDRELIWAKGYGFADLERKTPATTATIYRIGSISKVFTAIAVMQLRDADLLRLDDPVSEYLPWFQVQNSFPNARTITIRDLLTHTSGLPFDIPGVNWNEFSGPPLEEIIASFPDVEAIFPAGEHRYYSNFGFWVAGQIVTAVSGEPFAEYVDTHVLAPLGMKATDLAPEPSTVGLAVGYGARSPGNERKVWAFTDTTFITPAGDGASSVENMVRLVSLFMIEGESGTSRVLQQSTLREMQGFARDGFRSARAPGLGLFVRRINDQLRIGHGGDGGGFVASFTVAPANKFGVIVLTNSDDGEPWEYRNQAFQVVGPGVREAIETPGSTAVERPQWERYVGKYRWENVKVDVLLLDGQLTKLDPGSEDPWESRVRLAPEGQHTFRMLEVDSRYGEQMHFVLDADGKVTAAQIGAYQIGSVSKLLE